MTENKKTKLQGLVGFWNEAFPDNPLAEDHVKNPNEMSFRYYIILCLNSLHINTTCFANIDNESGSRLKASRCRLVAWTNEILLTASGSTAFKICYMDLLNPKRHCVLNCLQYLINYVAFVSHIDKAITKTHEEIKELEDLKTQRNHLKRVIESSKLSRNVEETITKFKERAERFKKELLIVQQEKDKCDFNIDDLRSKITAITSVIVSDVEAHNILETREEVKAQFKEQEEIIAAQRNGLIEMSQTIEKVQSAVNKMEQIISTSSLDVSDLKEMKDNYDNLDATITKLKHSILQSTNDIQILSHVVDKKKINIAKLQAQESEAEGTYKEVIKADLSVLKQRKSKLKELQTKENAIYNEQNTIKEETDLLYNITSNIVKHMSESIYE